jgi:hypothetical protein
VPVIAIAAWPCVDADYQQLRGTQVRQRLPDDAGRVGSLCDTDIKRRQHLGALASGVIQWRMTLAGFVREEWWPRYAVPNLALHPASLPEVWGTHRLPALGDYELRAITPMLVEDLRAQFDQQRVGVQTQRTALMLLRGILRRAVVRDLIPANRPGLRRAQARRGDEATRAC